VIQSKQADRVLRYETTRTIAKIVDTLRAFDPSGETLTEHHLLSLVPELVSQFWEVLLPCTPQFHVEAVEQIWNLRAISKQLLLVDSKIISLMCEDTSTAGSLEDQVARFSTLWMYTRFPEVSVESLSAQRSDGDDVPWALLRQPVL